MNWKQFNRANNLVGWAIFAVATLTYLLTIGPSASLYHDYDDDDHDDD